jgi:Carboxypeptidase regulatory-like domain
MTLNYRSLARLSAVLFALLPGAAWGQGFGTISGTITDPSGAAIPSVIVTVTEVATDQSRTGEASQDGYYVVNSLRPSTYLIQVDQPGFKRFTQTGVVLLANQSLTLNIRMAVGSTTENVSVNGTAAAVDTTTPTLRQVVDSARMADMPLNGRNAANLTTLVAGAVTAPSNNANQGNAKSFPVSVAISTNGARENQISYFLDGAPNMDIFSNVNQPFPFPDALQEFSVQTSDYSAEFGQDAGGVVSIVSKSGTNQFHGDAFGFLRNGALNARNYFARTADPLKRSQFGGVIGGPIIKDKTFFFGGYQGTRIRSNVGGNSAFVPTNANLNGDFSAMLNASDPNNPLHRQVVITDPLTHQPFPNNQIPVSRFDPASLAMLHYVSRATGAGQVIYGIPQIQNYDEYILRGDHSISANDKLVGRYYYDRFFNVGSYGGNLLAYGQGSTISSHNAVIQEMHIFSPKLLNDFRFAFFRIVSNRQPPAGTPTVATFGVPIFQPPIPAIQGITISGYFTTGANPTARFPRTSYAWIDDVRWTRGRHSFSFGGVYERDQLNMVNVLGEPGTFTFSGDTTGSALADFMLGQLRTFNQAMGQHVKNRNFAVDVYGQDSFRVSDRLTLSYGVRYDPSHVWNDLYHQNQVFYPDAYVAGTRSAVFPNAPPGLRFSGDQGVPIDGTTGDYRNIAPRVGFAYDARGNGKTSIRGGFGIFFDSRVPALSNNRELGAAPYSATVALTTPQGPFSNPYLNVPNPFPAPFPAPSNSQFVLPVLVYSWDPHNKLVTPRNYNVNLTLEQDLGHRFVARIAYVGSRGNYLTTTVDQNPAVYIPGSALATNARRPYQNFSNIFQISQSGNSWYHSGQFSILRPFTHGFTISANYTWSKSTDNLPFDTDAATFATSGYYTLPLNFPNFKRYDEGSSDYDHRHVFVASYVWQLPALSRMNSFTRQALGSWQLTGIATIESGQPLTLYAGVDESHTGIGSDRAVYATGQPAYNKKTNCGSVTISCLTWLNSSAFSLPPIGTFGNVGKGEFFGPGFFNWDMGIFKNFPIKERLSVEVRGEFFNIFNHTNFQVSNTGTATNNPVSTVSSAGFGHILAANDPRILQLALKILF